MDQDSALVLSQPDGLCQDLNIVDLLVGLKSAASRHYCFWFAVHDPIGQLFCSKSSENYGMNGPDASTAPGCEESLWNHRKVDYDPVPLLDSLRLE